MIGRVVKTHIDQFVEVRRTCKKATAINVPAATDRLIAVASGSTVLPIRMLEEERVVAFFVMAPAESGA